MNDKQKIFVMVGVGSFAVILLTIFGLEQFSLENPFSSWHALDADAIRSGKKHTNWFGMIAVFNIVVSALGFILFKDK
jgi:hypothetical protein